MIQYYIQIFKFLKLFLKSYWSINLKVNWVIILLEIFSYYLFFSPFILILQ